MTQRDPYLEGSWYGNDTLWRTILDLNKILLYANKEGQLRDNPQRTRLYFVDGIVVGEKEGPLEPHPCNLGLVFFGRDPALVDLSMAAILGFNFRKIPSISHSFQGLSYKISTNQPQDLKLQSNDPVWNNKSYQEIQLAQKIIPSCGWAGMIEKTHKPREN